MATENISIDSSTTLADDFYNLFNISKPIENDPYRPHPKYSTYCRKFCPSSAQDGVKRLQEKRRQEMLENLKRKREKLLDNLRPIIFFIENNESSDCNDLSKSTVALKNFVTAETDNVDSSNVCKSEAMQVDDRMSNARRNRFTRNRNWRLKSDKEFRKLISKQLMLSEWLVDVPADFYTDWYMVFCPQGRRALVIAANGQTRIYSRTGYFMFQFQSLLPGGSRVHGASTTSGKNSILDCIYVEEEHTFYVLDLISWNGCTFLDCETEFRFFWLHSRFAEEFPSSQPTSSKNHSSEFTESLPHSDVEMQVETSTHFAQHIGKQSEKISPGKNSFVSKLYNFVPLVHHDCTIENISRNAQGPFQFNVNIDGVLFFHKRAPYTSGITPLVCWLKVKMIPEILQIALA